MCFFIETRTLLFEHQEDDANCPACSNRPTTHSINAKRVLANCRTRYGCIRRNRAQRASTQPI
ncbi:hypothetical protein RRSWK_02908 [Rhodopirellula sp. SWK7]|nr:hypothetical protein RRSWK_02908 [Rhodopirellula sp. SWK7]